MPILSVYQSYPLFFDKAGNPLDDGDIYVGTAGSNAVDNQVQAYFDNAKTIAASQPISTNAGYPINPATGARAMIFVDSTDYSLVVRDKNGVTIVEENNMTDLTYKSASASDDNATDIATNTANIATNTTNISTNTSNISTNTTKLAGIEAGADVTDATNVAAAGATMDTDTSLSGNGYFLDEDDMASDDATKAASQQSIKAYVDGKLGGANRFAVRQSENLTGSGTSWTTSQFGTRIDTTDPGFLADTEFYFDFTTNLTTGTNDWGFNASGVIYKEKGAQPGVSFQVWAVQTSGTNDGAAYEANGGLLSTSGSTVAVNTAHGTPAFEQLSSLNVERVDTANELTFRFNLVISTSQTNVGHITHMSGSKFQSGSSISSALGTVIYGS